VHEKKIFLQNEHSRLNQAFIFSYGRIRASAWNRDLRSVTADDALPALRKIVIALLSLDRVVAVMSPLLQIANLTDFIGALMLR